MSNATITIEEKENEEVSVEINFTGKANDNDKVYYLINILMSKMAETIDELNGNIKDVEVRTKAAPLN